MLYSPVSCWVSSESSWRPVQPSEAHSGSPRQPDQVLHSARQQHPPHPPPLWAAPELRCCSEAKDTGRKVNINIWRKQYKSPIRILKKIFIFTRHIIGLWPEKGNYKGLIVIHYLLISPGAALRALESRAGSCGADCQWFWQYGGHVYTVFQQRLGFGTACCCWGGCRVLWPGLRYNCFIQTAAAAAATMRAQSCGPQ